ncbi:GNAT family N-acetyltransferase [Streptomyces sp. NPDC057651]|uniref:GNAT family N-acetyltransferase n=1 Tax=Streptomyces sp. NPDC057651 TaxID=3346194 RepID=UPI0036A84BBE
MGSLATGRWPPFGTAPIDAQSNGKRDHCHLSRPRDLRKDDLTQLLMRTGASPNCGAAAWCAGPRRSAPVPPAELALGGVASASDEAGVQGVVKGQKWTPRVGLSRPRSRGDPAGWRPSRTCQVRAGRTNSCPIPARPGGTRTPCPHPRPHRPPPPCLAAEPVAHEGARHTAAPPGPCRPRTARSGGQAPVDVTVGGDLATIDTVAVRPDHQCQGHGRALLKEAKARTRALGLVALDAWTQDLPETLRWYRAMGSSRATTTCTSTRTTTPSPGNRTVP